MPKFVGSTAAEALKILVQRCGRKPTIMQGASDFPLGTVYNQYPAPGTDLALVKGIILYVSTGPSPTPIPTPPQPVTPVTVQVPDVVGLPESNAVAIIEGNKLRPVRRGEEPGCRELGQITRTTPVAGATLESDTSVGYWVANGKNVVPDLQGQAMDGASALLQQYCFRLGRISYQPSVSDVVLNQDPAASTLAPVNSEIEITRGDRRWIFVLLAGGLLAAALTGVMWWRTRLAQITRELLTIHPSIDLDGEASFPDDVRTIGPTTHIQASIEFGEVSSGGRVPIIRREVLDG
jgi:hypothetical protein